MLRKLLIPALALASMVILCSGDLSGNGKAGRTGSPNESTCHNCHGSYTQNTGGGSITLASANMTGWEYTPGTTYHMTATVARTGNSLFGLGLEALTNSNGNAGTLTVTSNSTSIKTATVSGVSRRNVVHTSGGGAGPGSKAFTFDWVAPSTNIGNVTFYFAGLASNNNGGESGDYVYTGSQVVAPALGTGMEEISAAVGMSVYPNPVSDVLTISYTANKAGRVEASLYDLNGGLVERLVSAERQPGKQAEVISGMQRHAAGTYILKILIDGGEQQQRLVLTSAERN